MLRSWLETCLSWTIKAAKTESTGKALLALRRGQLGCLKSKPGLVARPLQCFVTMFKGCLYTAVQLHPCWERTIKIYGWRTESLLFIWKGKGCWQIESWQKLIVCKYYLKNVLKRHDLMDWTNSVYGKQNTHTNISCNAPIIFWFILFAFSVENNCLCLLSCRLSLHCRWTRLQTPQLKDRKAIFFCTSSSSCKFWLSSACTDQGIMFEKHQWSAWAGHY